MRIANNAEVGIELSFVLHPADVRAAPGGPGTSPKGIDL